MCNFMNEILVKNSKIKLVQGDITESETDAYADADEPARWPSGAATTPHDPPDPLAYPTSKRPPTTRRRPASQHQPTTPNAMAFQCISVTTR